MAILKYADISQHSDDMNFSEGTGGLYSGYVHLLFFL